MASYAFGTDGSDTTVEASLRPDSVVIDRVRSCAYAPVWPVAALGTDHDEISAARAHPRRPAIVVAPQRAQHPISRTPWQFREDKESHEYTTAKLSPRSLARAR